MALSGSLPQVNLGVQGENQEVHHNLMQNLDGKQSFLQLLMWIDGPEKDHLVLRTKNWRTLAGRRLVWKMLLEKSNAHPGLSRR
ncbi:hypothetical protein TNCV_2659421 [Trichonephila clavipes]|uniref:Uncharacterized protein n=1 Tax=Trichonephila clavipes TaxID=2585209 RepID=A0A8X6UQJ4_TRICX|nr:hypothetical protein TNCV_2659421 [Trichonephila clavipes]